MYILQSRELVARIELAIDSRLPLDYKSSALPSELYQRVDIINFVSLCLSNPNPIVFRLNKSQQQESNLYCLITKQKYYHCTMLAQFFRLPLLFAICFLCFFSLRSLAYFLIYSACSASSNSFVEGSLVFIMNDPKNIAIITRVKHTINTRKPKTILFNLNTSNVIILNCEGRNRTTDSRLMRPVSYHCFTPRHISVLHKLFLR